LSSTNSSLILMCKFINIQIILLIVRRVRKMKMIINPKPKKRIQSNLVAQPSHKSVDSYSMRKLQ